jgi:hypothetical protein
MLYEMKEYCHLYDYDAEWIENRHEEVKKEGIMTIYEHCRQIPVPGFYTKIRYFL